MVQPQVAQRHALNILTSQAISMSKMLLFIVRIKACLFILHFLVTALRGGADEVLIAKVQAALDYSPY